MAWAVGGLAAVSMTDHLLAAGRPGAVPAHLLMAAAGAELAAVDLARHRLPDRLTLGVLPPLAALIVLACLTEGRPAALLTSALAAVVSAAFYLLLALGVPGGLGFGDVKLSVSLGALLGWWSAGTAATGVFLAFLVGGLAALALLVTRRANRHTAMAFGPAMLVGAWWAVLLA